MTVWLTCNACWIPKDTNTYSEYVILISLLLQTWVQERASGMYIVFFKQYDHIGQLVSQCDMDRGCLRERAGHCHCTETG